MRVPYRGSGVDWQAAIKDIWEVFYKLGKNSLCILIASVKTKIPLERGLIWLTQDNSAP